MAFAERGPSNNKLPFSSCNKLPFSSHAYQLQLEIVRMRRYSRKNLISPPTFLSIVLYLYQQQCICPPVQFLFDVMTHYLHRGRIWKVYQEADLMHMARMPNINQPLNEKPVYFNQVELSPCHYSTCSNLKDGAVTICGSVRLIIIFLLKKQSRLKNINMMPSMKSRYPFMMQTSETNL